MNIPETIHVSLSLHERLGYLINQTRNAVLTAIDDELAPLDVTAAQFIVVVGIAQGEVRTPSGLCKLLGFDSGAMTRLIDRLESKGIVSRHRHGDDRRMVSVELPPKGWELQPLITKAAAAGVRLLSRHRPKAADLSRFTAYQQKQEPCSDVLEEAGYSSRPKHFSSRSITLRNFAVGRLSCA